MNINVLSNCQPLEVLESVGFKTNVTKMKLAEKICPLTYFLLLSPFPKTYIVVLKLLEDPTGKRNLLNHVFSTHPFKNPMLKIQIDIQRWPRCNCEGDREGVTKQKST